ncbi:pirin family protein [Rouxiella sp. S1S-2]|uniref:pirin family protein n=1 Tax=Rouxiella sp. S1S-2 TaxID=2653856 RepID=UPI0012641891|nr:pirin family protein [Rouxiella sp. S1S-2]KAB7898538.1 pirin family protein [Rouxiella sp. S1S-2]
MIKSRTAQECGKADFGWLQARYTFSFGHYFDPKLMGYASLRVLNQEILAPGASFQPRTYPRVDVLNLVLQGEVEYRDSVGNSTRIHAGQAALLSTQPNVSYSEHNLSHSKPLTRMQLWLDACPAQENPLVQKIELGDHKHFLLASPGGEENSLQLRQQVWIHHINLKPGEHQSFPINGPRAYLQSIHGQVDVQGGDQHDKQSLVCGDGAFIHQEQTLTVKAITPLQALLIDLPV